MKLIKIAAATLLGAIISLSPAMAQQDITLKVASFAGPFGESLQKYAFDLFTRRTGIKIEVIYANPADHLAKMIASRGREAPFDVVCLDDDVTASAKDAGVLAKLDPSIVTNLAHLYPDGQDKDNFSAIMFYYSVGLTFNKAKLKEAGIPEPTSWHDLWDPRLAGHVSVPDIINIQGRDFIIQMARLNGGDETTPEKGIDKIAEIKVNSYYAASNTLQAQLESGDIWMVPWNSMRSAAMADRRLPIGYVVPKEGAIGNTDNVALAAGSAHPKEAQMLINYILDPFTQLGITQLLPTGPSNKLLEATVRADTDLARKAPATPEAHKQLYLPNWSVFNKNMKKTTDYWNRKIQK